MRARLPGQRSRKSRVEESLAAGASQLVRWVSRTGRSGDLSVVRNVSYVDDHDPEHRLDVYRPRHAHAPLPVLMYIHGGGFMMLSKESHWMFAHLFARAGYAVFNVNYRLDYEFPHALQDVAKAFLWIKAHARDYGADANRFAIAGESAGGNLTLALTAMACFERPEPYAKPLLGQTIKAVLPMCGLLETSNPERYWPGGDPTPMQKRIRAVSHGYAYGGDEPLASPILILESKDVPKHPLPPMFSSVGTKDPIMHDTERLEAALRARDIPHQVTYHEGEQHAFQAAYFRAEAKKHWRDSLAFLGAHNP